MPILLSILKAIGIRGAIAIMLGVALLVTGLRLNHAKHDLANARDEITRLNGVEKALRTSLAASEGNRGIEYQQAKDALAGAALDCRDQVARARESQRIIRQIVTKPVPVNAAGCPVPDLVSADELRTALGGR